MTTSARPSTARLSPPGWWAHYLDTLRALAQPRRALPLTLVCGVLVVSELLQSTSAFHVGVAIAMCGSFVLVGPAAWRLLVTRRAAARPWWLGFAAYVVLGVGCVLFAGSFVLGRPPSFLYTPTSLVVASALFLVGGWGLGRDIDLEQALAQTERRAAELAWEAEHARLLAMRSHLDPHFLFNTLNAIAEWCREDAAVAEAAILRLSGLLRTVLRGVHEPTWPLADELDLVTELLETWHIRDPERYAFVVEVDDATLESWPCPSMVLLPVVENALKHGVGAGHSGRTQLRVTALDADHIAVEVRNPGALRPDAAEGEGLPTVRRRLRLAFADGASRFTLASHSGDTIAQLVLPRATTRRTEIP